MKDDRKISLITPIISSCKKFEEMGYGKTGSRKIIRECIHFFWETGNNKPTKFSKKRIRSLMATKENNNKNLRYDHPVPLRVVCEILFSLDKINEKNIKFILEKFIKNGGVLITKDEDNKLTKMGLKSSMPENWNGEDIFARYKKADIEIVHT